MKKNIGIFLVMCIMLTACKNDKFPYDDELDDSEKNEISTEYDSLIDRKIANTKDEKINIGYDEALSEYEGYLDNVKLFEEGYKNQDYDGDGKTDRIFQYFRNDNKKVYTICFGNGDHLELGAFDDTFLGLEVWGADITGDGKNEIVFCGEHTGNTWIQSGSEIAIWRKDGSEYTRMNLPGKQTGMRYSAGYDIYIEKTEQEDIILVTCPELDLEEEYVLPENQREEFDSCYKDLKVGEKILSSSKAWKIAVDGKDIFLYEAFLDRLTAAVEIKMQWKENTFEVMNTEILEEYL